MKKKIMLVFGGKSAEHEVSINSARNIAAAIDTNKFELIPVCISIQGTWLRFPDLDSWKNLATVSDSSLPKAAEICSLVYFDQKPQLLSLKTHKYEEIHCAFPINHGTFGEDGCIQGLFKMMNLPFVGCDVLASSAGMDKDVMKRLFLFQNLPTAKYVTLTQQVDMPYESLVQKLGLPFFLKPANMGSSVGVHKIKSLSDFNTKKADAFLYDHKLIAEEYIEGREIECSVMGHRFECKASVCGEVIPQHEFYSYEAKYLDDNGAKLQIPAQLADEKMNEIKTLAMKVFQTMGAEGLARIDFFLKKNGEIFVNELNTLPGFTKISMYPKMWDASGIKYSALITDLIDLAFWKYDSDRKLKTTFLDLK